MSDNPLLLKSVPQNFLMGGFAVFTVKSDAGEHKTFRIDRSEPVYNVKDDPESGVKWPEAWWVGLLTGPDNKRDYSNFGRVNPQTSEITLLRKTTMTLDSEAVRLVQLILDYSFQGKELPEGLWVQQPSHCGRCGRLLTAPKEKNPYFPWLGPECGTKV